MTLLFCSSVLIQIVEWKYLNEDDIDFILKNDIDEEGAGQIDSVKSMISFYIERSEIIEPIILAVEDLLQPDKSNSPTVLKWKKI